MPISSKLTAVLLTRSVAFVETAIRTAWAKMISPVTAQQLFAVPSKLNSTGKTVDATV